MGGYLQYSLYELAALGWVEETVRPLVDGITESIIHAHESMQEGSVGLSFGELLDTNINRSPQSYLMNPVEERSMYKHDVDKHMTVLGFRSKKGDNLGLVSWFPVHGVSVNKTNRLINGDNKGYASYLTEKIMNKDTLSGQFVAAFAQSNSGDVSPNTLGPYCSGTDIPCDGTRKLKCPKGTTCNGRGPRWYISDIESNRVIGSNQAMKALELYKTKSISVEGKVDYVQQYWDITKSVVHNKHAAGTTDGPASFGFYQNTTKSTVGWDLIKNMIRTPTEAQVKCQQPKPILLDTGNIQMLNPWQPSILDIQLFRLGNVFVYAVPSEFTTMSGRRLKKAIQQAVIKHGLGDETSTILHSGPANGYASYCTTWEEYQHQRYEGASTPYGAYTLDAYIQAFEQLVYKMAYPHHNMTSEELPDYTNSTFNLSPRYRSDQPHLFRSFGDLLRDVQPKLVKRRSFKGQSVIMSALFVAGNPRNDPMRGKTFLTVEKKVENDWKIIRTDDDYDTRFYWKYKRQLLGMSEALIEWHIDSTIEAGTYRLGYFGHSCSPFNKTISPHHGYSNEFYIT
ncbi:Neutral/alkaline nonlysosomal ceramidase [Pilobolus umbonatus]|nr:Neutral/alkaline nonlysosomal ceramidase [Pilobolus umbonatus]